MKPKDDFKFFRGLGYLEENEGLSKTEEELELLHKRMVAQCRAQIRVSTRRAFFSSAILILAFVGFYLMDEGMPFREWAPIGYPLLGYVFAIPALGLAMIFWTHVILARLLVLNRTDDL